MKVSYQWLNDYVDASGYSGSELAELLTRGGIEVDVVEARNKGVSGVVVGYVKQKEKHPDADKLNVCTVDVGAGEDLQIVCGAANVAAGQYVPVAMIGAKLPGGLAIKRTKLRGVESQGMICSAKELGINDKLLPKELQEGILVLPASVTVGESIIEVLGLADEVLELDLTPNRADCLSMLGAAYEIGALVGKQPRLPVVGLPAAPLPVTERVKVAIEAEQLCSHYTARYIEGIKLAPAPLWLQNRLIAAGVRPINNIVDITNYVMLEYGQPLHAFDAAKVAQGQIVVRLPREGEQLTTLDGQERKLDASMLVIADAEKPIALAGVMGGLNSEVTEDTTAILLESARFDGGTVRKTSRQLGLRSEASIRFEKGVDPERVIAALDRAAALIAELAGGTVAGGVAEAKVGEPAPVAVAVTLDKINGYLGTALSAEEVGSILQRLGFPYTEDGGFRVEVPSRRGDITRAVDIIEEIARLYGYDNIPTTAIEGASTAGSLTGPQAIRRHLRRSLADAGLYEAITYSFTDPSRAALFQSLSGPGELVRLAMPMSEERSVLRTSLLPNLIDAAVYNHNRKVKDVALFEIGSVFHTAESKLATLPEEKQRLAILLTGQNHPTQWNRVGQPYDFYDAKGVLDTVFELLGVAGRITYVSTQAEQFHPGRTAAIWLETASGSEQIGLVGQLHPALQGELDLADTYAAELDLAGLYTYATQAIAYKPLPKYPAVQRDIALVVDEGVAAGAIELAIRAAAGPLLESVHVFDVYTGDKLGAGKKSVALALVYRHAERTLAEEDVVELHSKVLEQLGQSFQAELRK